MPKPMTSYCRRLSYALLLYCCVVCAQPEAPLPPVVKASPEVAETFPTLSLREAILLAMRQNPDVKSAELQRVIDKFSLAVARNQFLPQVALSGSALYQTNGKPSYSALPGVSWLSPIGTQVKTQLTQTVNNNDNPPVSNNAELVITQPLLRGFGTKITQLNLNTALDNEKANQLNFKNQIMDIVIKVVNAYYDVVQAQNSVKIGELSLQDVQSIYQQTLAKIKNGKAAPADAIQQQAAIAEQQLNLSSDRNKVTQSYQTLLGVLGLDPNAQLTIISTIAPVSVKIPDLAESIALALQNNIDYQKTLIEFRNAERELVRAKDSRRWQLDAVATINEQLNKSASTVNGSSQSLAFNLNIPVRDIESKKALVEAKINLDRARTNIELKKRQLITDVTNSHHDLEFNQQQMNLYENSLKLSQQSLAISKTKFKYGKAALFELLTMQTGLTKTQLGAVTQKIAYLKAIENFYQLLGKTLDKWQLTLAY